MMGRCIGANAADAAAPTPPTDGTETPICDGVVGDEGGANEDCGVKDDEPYATRPSGDDDGGSFGDDPFARRAASGGRGASGG